MAELVIFDAVLTRGRAASAAREYTLLDITVVPNGVLATDL
jgi:hypothetical protein